MNFSKQWTLQIQFNHVFWLKRGLNVANPKMLTLKNARKSNRNLPKPKLIWPISPSTNCSLPLSSSSSTTIPYTMLVNSRKRKILLTPNHKFLWSFLPHWSHTPLFKLQKLKALFHPTLHDFSLCVNPFHLSLQKLSDHNTPSIPPPRLSLSLMCSQHHNNNNNNRP